MKYIFNKNIFHKIEISTIRNIYIINNNNLK